MYRTCVIGCGRMGRLHGERLQNDPRCELVAFYDQQPALAATLRRELAPTAQVLEAWDDVLRLNLDVAVICTPTTAHYQQVREGLERGWHWPWICPGGAGIRSGNADLRRHAF